MSIIQQFLEEHAGFRLFLDRTAEMAASIKPGAPAPQPNEESLNFFIRLRRHARLETEILFPAMQSALSETDRIKAVEHFIKHGNDEHYSVAKRQSEWMAAPSGTAWVDTFQRFRQGLLAHMAMEEEAIFPQAQSLLSPDMLEKLRLKGQMIPT